MRQFILLLGLCLVWLNAWSQELSATVDRNELNQNETLQLTIALTGKSFVTDPDLSQLSREFDILGSAKSNQVSIINGKTSQQLTWQIALVPKHSGALIIPALQVANLKTTPIKIAVSKSQNRSGKADRVLLEVAAAPRESYIKSQFLYTVRLFFADQLQGAALTDPLASNAIMLRLSNDTNYQLTRHGRRYNVIERRYAIFPQSSGTINITPPSFIGQVVKRDSINPFFPELQTLRLTAEPINITIKPKPPEIPLADWLPAQDLTLSETWSADISQSRIGDPISRTLTLSAVGLSGEQLPDLSKLSADSFKVYAAKPKIITSADNKAVLGQRVVKLNYLPAKSGALTVPELRLSWWNTQAQKSQIIKIPARTIHVAPAPTTTVNTPLSTTKTLTDNAKTKAVKNYWPWIITVLVTLAWLLTLLFWWRYTQKKNNLITVKESAEKYFSEIKAVCEINDPNRTKQALINWSYVKWPDKACRSLMDIAEQLNNPAFKHALQTLDSSLYSNQKIRWNGAEFWQQFSTALNTIKPKPAETKNRLPPLYPQ